jgi:hypothetical protein
VSAATSGTAKAVLLALSMGWLAGCSTMPTPQYQTAVANRPPAAGPAVAVGDARASAGVKNGKVSLRGAAMAPSSSDGTFSGYLREALIAELAASNRYSADASRRIELELTQHQVNASGIKEGVANLATRVIVKEGDAVRLDKTYDAEHRWDSSFIGAVAIPAAYDNYPTAVQKLLVAILSDDQFQAAIQ